VNERDRREFGEFAAARSGALIGLAYVLTGDQHAAEDLLQTALTRVAAAATDAAVGPLWNLLTAWPFPGRPAGPPGAGNARRATGQGRRTLADLPGWYWDQNRG
jgi:hypothetical protein